MGRKVKCQVTKELGDSSEFYKAPNGKYYKTKEIYNHWKHETEDRKECIRLICEYGNYNGENYAPTFLNKMIADFGNKVGYAVLLDTIKECEQAFLWANDNKEFNNELGRLFYYKSIIGNHIVDIYKKHQRIKEQERFVKQELTELPENIDKVGCPIGGGKDLRNLLGDI